MIDPTRRRVLALLGSSGVLAACSSLPAAPRQPVAPPAPGLRFDPAAFTPRSITVEGTTLAIRAYEGLAYVARPVEPAYQCLNLYIPAAYFDGGEVGGFTAATAPIFLPNQVGGYMPALPGKLDGRAFGPPPGGGQAPAAAMPNAIQYALSRGFVVAAPGARGRTLQAASGEYTGKAPAAIVDLKAAVRYLRANRERLPGNTERIISNGTSAGGALSALLGASGGQADYAPYLAALGAAEARDDIFAVSAYCPITNLAHADAAYEWQFAGVDSYRKIDISMLDYQVQRKTVSGTLDARQREVSAALAASFPAYVNSLGLRAPDGSALQLAADGQGSFRDYVASLLLQSARTALAQGRDLSALDWLQWQGGQPVALRWPQYLAYLGRMKTPPAFDALDGSSGENQLFGSASEDKRHFTAFGQQHGTQASLGQAEAAVVRMMEPLSYIGQGGGQPAAHWRIRHGSKDSDTSLAVPVMLATVLRNHGYAVDLTLPWDVPHSGDYDLPALFDWATAISRAG